VPELCSGIFIAMKYLLGEKVGMTQVFDETGNVIPVTVISAAPNTVLRIKTQECDGYAAMQVGFGTRNKKHFTKADIGALRGNTPRHIREFRLDSAEDRPEQGAKIDVSVFSEGDIVRISGISKAKGFQGGVKRHGFHGAPATHGTKHAHRQPGSIGATGPQKVLKGTKMAGRMGGELVSVRGLRIARVDATHALIAVCGAVPGRKGTLVEILG
jgi:large subunit ribosomal protein L3